MLINNLDIRRDTFDFDTANTLGRRVAEMT